MVDIGKIRAIYKGSDTAKMMLDSFADRQRNRGETKVEWVLQLIEDSSPDARSEVVRIFRELALAGCGAFLVGRRQKPSRFVWEVPLVEVGQAARGDLEEVAGSLGDDVPEGDEADVAPKGMIVHVYRLRPDVNVSMTLPEDLSAAEADRLANFVKTLPFG